MLDEGQISEMLESTVNRHNSARGIRTLRGVRGVPHGDVARIAAEAWKDNELDLGDDRAALERLFGMAWEDGMIAIGLTAAALPDDAEEALDIGLGWLSRIDDTGTADALGWMVLGPAVLSTGTPIARLVAAAKDCGHVAARRAAVAAGLAMTSEKLEGPAAAPLRERLGDRSIRFVEGAISPFLTELLLAFVYDDAAEVRKGVRRVLRAWTKDDPQAVVDWGEQVKGGLPKLLGQEVTRARRAAARLE